MGTVIHIDILRATSTLQRAAARRWEFQERKSEAPRRPAVDRQASPDAGGTGYRHISWDIDRIIIKTGRGQ